MEKLDLRLSGVVTAFGSFAPRRLQVPEERNSSLPSIGIPSTALAVSWVGQSTTFMPLYCPKMAPGWLSPVKSSPGRPSLSVMSLSNSRVAAFTRPVVLALVYSCAFPPQSRHIRYTGIISQPVAPSSRPASLSA